MLSEREEGKLFGRRRWDWDRFRKVYPEAKGIISLSNIGFNATRTQALVYAAIGCGPCCGEGSFILLQKVNGRWSVQLKIVAVVS